jgi:hypothetical protein
LSPVLTGPAPEGPVSLHLGGRRLLRAVLVTRGGTRVLLEADGTELSADTPLAALLNRADLIATLPPDGAPLDLFCRGSYRYRLRTLRVRCGAELVIETPDGRELDAHLTPIRALLPVRAWPFSRPRLR